eukprot:756785-Hanusia_phi.AAC.1
MVGERTRPLEEREAMWRRREISCEGVRCRRGEGREEVSGGVEDEEAEVEEEEEEVEQEEAGKFTLPSAFLPFDFVRGEAEILTAQSPPLPCPCLR